MQNRLGWLQHIEPPLRLPDITAAGTILLVIRWLCLVLSLILASFDYSTAGVLLAPGYAAAIVAAWNLLLATAGRRVSWLQHPRNFLALDTLLAGVIVFVTGGYHSGFFILLIGAVISGSLYLSLAHTVWFTLGVGVLFQVACSIGLYGAYTQEALYLIAIKLLILQAMGFVVGLLLEGLRREHQDAESQKVQSAQLAALNTFMQRVSASLELDAIVQTTSDAARALLSADLALALLTENGSGALHTAAASGIALEAATLSLSLEDPEVQTALETPIVWSTSANAVSRLVGRLGPEAAGIRHLASVPLRLDESVLGLLAIGRRAERAFGDEELPLLQSLAQEATLAVRNARRYQSERLQAERLGALDRNQRQMISSIAHELRTPLTCIRTSVDLLRATPSPALQEEVIGTIDHQAIRLDGLVTDLLESSRLEVGQVTLTRQPTDMRLIVERTVRSMTAMIEQKGQHLDTSLPEEGVMADVDRRRLEQVLTNLLANATKFTPRGGHIWITLAREEGQVLIAVADDGPGIAAEHLPFVFERSYTVPSGTAKTGLGLGLFIAQQLAELHDGRITAASTLGQGATFTVTLPTWQEEDA